jgi:hypothetical protein
MNSAKGSGGSGLGRRASVRPSPMCFGDYRWARYRGLEEEGGEEVVGGAGGDGVSSWERAGRRMSDVRRGRLPWRRDRSTPSDRLNLPQR